MRILVLGTSSGAGKTTFSAMLCRYLHNEGVDVAPFKGSNLSNTSFVTKDGGEIGVGQQFQALACGIEPETDMNPVLLKSVSRGHIAAYIDGRATVDITPGHPLDHDMAMEHVHQAFDRLYDRHEFIVCEGSGSPAEVNLYDRDLANTGLMRELRIPAVLVADIEKGGVFAAIYGTWLLMPDELKPLLRGVVINRFRGEDSILKSGISSHVPYIAAKTPPFSMSATSIAGILSSLISPVLARSLS